MYGRLVDSGHAFLLANPVDENDEYDVCACDARENETQMLFAEKKMNDYYVYFNQFHASPRQKVIY